MNSRIGNKNDEINYLMIGYHNQSFFFIFYKKIIFLVYKKRKNYGTLTLSP